MTDFETVTIHGTEHLRLGVAGVVYAIPPDTDPELTGLLDLSRQASKAGRFPFRSTARKSPRRT